MSDIDTELTATPTAVIVGLTQIAARFQSDITSCYWSISKGQKPPRVFINQARDRVLEMKALLDQFDKYVTDIGTKQ